MTRATNSLAMKRKNQKMLLSIIRETPTPRVQIAERMGLTKAAVTLLTEELTQTGLIKESESDYTGVGRKPILLTINNDFYYAIGINITRKHCTFGIIDLGGKVLAENIISTASISPNEVIKEIITGLEDLFETNNIKREKLLGIGVSTPGPVDYKTNTILTPPNFEKWHNFNLNSLSTALNLPLRTENIANAYALGEQYFGSRKANDNFITVIVDDGIGSGIITDGKIHRGGSGLGNELGHISIDFNGKPCNCGNIGCLEQYASIPCLLDGTNVKDWKEVIDKNLIDIMEKEVRYLSAALISAINLFDFKTIVLGGKLSYKGEIFAGKLYDALKNKNITKSKISVVPGGSQNEVLIAGTLIIDRFFKGDD